MVSRRQFVTSAAGAAAGMLVPARSRDSHAAETQAPRAGDRRQITVGGRRVRTVDVHAHCEIPGVKQLMGDATPLEPTQIVGPERLRLMDDAGIDVEVLSINPFWYGTDRQLARRLIQAQNEKLAELCARHPDRFVGLATVALQHPDLAAEQLEHGIKQLGLRGGSVGASVGTEELAASRFDPFWAKAEQLAAPIFVHPQGVPELEKRLTGDGMLSNVIGNPLATTIALSHLIFEGTLDRFPRLLLCAAHGGGYLPSYADRSDYGCGTRPDRCTKTLKKRPTDYLKQLYFDSLVFSGEALRHLVAVCGAGQIMLGTDDPFPWTSAPRDARLPRFVAVDHVLETPGLSDADRIAILGGNAARLFNLPAS